MKPAFALFVSDDGQRIEWRKVVDGPEVSSYLLCAASMLFSEMAKASLIQQPQIQIAPGTALPANGIDFRKLGR